MSPIDSADPSRSNTGVHVTPLLTVLNTPPDAVPTKMIEGLPTTASTSSMRPPNDAGPMWRHEMWSSARGAGGRLWLCARPIGAAIQAEYSTMMEAKNSVRRGSIRWLLSMAETSGSLEHHRERTSTAPIDSRDRFCYQRAHVLFV